MLEKLSRYLQAWELSDPQPLIETATSHVYIVTLEKTQVILKLLTPIGVEDEQKGAIALRCFNGQGAVRLLRADEQAHLLEYADGEDLTALVKRGEDARATAIIADVLNTLHAAPQNPPPAGLTPLNVWFRGLFIRAEQDARQGLNTICVGAAPIAAMLLADQREVRVLHGDIHHWNIRYSAQRGWLAFDPKGLLGERTYDAANTLCNPWNMPTLIENETRLLNSAALLAQKLDIEFSRLLTFGFAYMCLSASWILNDGQDASHVLRLAKIVEPHLQTSKPRP